MVCVQREKFKILSVNFKVNITMKKSFGKESYTFIIYIDRCAKNVYINKTKTNYQLTLI